MPIYAQVIIPKPLDGTFTYLVPDEMASKARPGHRVLVPFGGKRYYTGLVESVSEHAPSGVALKPVAVALDDEPVVRHPQVKLWKWLADYYLCSVGEVFHAALPSGLRIESETVVELAADEIDESVAAELSDSDLQLLELIRSSGTTTSKDLAKASSRDDVEASVNRLIALNLIKVSERSLERFSRRRTSFVKPLFDISEADAVKKVFKAVGQSERQQTMLLTLLSMWRECRLPTESGVPLDDALKRSALTRPVVKALADKGLVEIDRRYISRFQFTGKTEYNLPELSQAQQTALSQIHHSFFDHDITLLHGVTSCGKTELYIHLIDHVLRDGNQTLLLVPEIALTTQLTERLQRVFGTRVLIYHSKFSDAERMEVWQKLLGSNEPCVVIGARSSVFLPFARLGLVIVDEEHETSYKQADPAPRYNGRDTAIVLAAMHGAKTLLGSATPSVETYYKATTGKFGLVTLSERYGGGSLPPIEVIDLNREFERGATTGTFADHTVMEARKVLAAGHQVIFFHNRRGFSPMARCKLCAFIPKCDHCDVSLTYHRMPEQLVCHYCGAVYPMPAVCPSCHEPAIAVVGYGTERLEDNISRYFPNRNILRMDLDTTRNKNGYQQIIDTFSARKADILVGTQMVTKGLDFGGVAMVVVVNADALIHYPEFRAAERAFNMMEQVSGRAGRRSDVPGRVLIQTREPAHPVIEQVVRHDYAGFYKHEIEERKAYLYPPFVRLVNIYLKHRDNATVERHAAEYAARLRQLFGNRVHGPIEPKVSRVKSLYIRRIMLKIEPEASMTRVKHYLRDLYIDIRKDDLYKQLTLYYDVDP